AVVSLDSHVRLSLFSRSAERRAAISTRVNSYAPAWLLPIVAIARAEAMRTHTRTPANLQRDLLDSVSQAATRGRVVVPILAAFPAEYRAVRVQEARVKRLQARGVET